MVPLVFALLALAFVGGSMRVSAAPAPPTPPLCALTAVIAGPPQRIQITVQDTDDGLQSIELTVTTKNTALSVPSFVPGSTSPVVVTATLIDQSKPGVVALKITDTGGNVTNCSFDYGNVSRVPEFGASPVLLAAALIPILVFARLKLKNVS